MTIPFNLIFFSFYHVRKTDMRDMDVVGKLCVCKKM